VKIESEINGMLKYAEKLKMSGAYKKAINTCEEILLIDIERNIAYEEIADNFLNLEDTEKAKKALFASLKLDPNSVNANYLMGFAYSIENEWDESVIYLEKANSLRENNPEILRCLGWSLFNYKKETEGIMILQRAKNLSPKNSFILCDLGVCYMMKNDFGDAVEIFRIAQQMYPRDKKIKECIRIAKFFNKNT